MEGQKKPDGACFMREEIPQAFPELIRKSTKKQSSLNQKGISPERMALCLK